MFLTVFAHLHRAMHLSHIGLVYFIIGRLASQDIVQPANVPVTRIVINGVYWLFDWYKPKDNYWSE